MHILYSVFNFLFPRLSALLSPCVILLVLLILQKTYFRDFKKTLLYIIFSFYLLIVFRLTGLPDCLNMHFNPRIQLIPFYGMQDDAFNCLLNVFLFIPFGFFLPSLWRQFFSFRNTMITAALFTVFIEITQLFCSRLTDVNDLITNTLGALIGFCILRIFTKAFPKLFRYEFRKRECALIFGLTFSMAFFLDPVIYYLLKDLQAYFNSTVWIASFVTSVYL